MKRALVSLPDELFHIMNSKLKGKFGQNASEIIRGIVIAYLSQQGYLKSEDSSSQTSDIQEDMIGAMVETLEEKGIMTGRDIDSKMRKRLKSKGQLTRLGELK